MMRSKMLTGIIVAIGAAAFLNAQAPAPAPARGGGAGNAGAGRQAGAPAADAGRQGGVAAGRQGGGGGGAAAGGYGTTNTLYTIAESGSGSAANDPTAEQLAASPEAQAIIANAKRIAGTDLVKEVTQFCTWNAGANVPPRSDPPPIQVSDNLYYVGTGGVGAFIIKTSDGIILWDTLNSEDEAKTILEPGLKKFGMDASQIKYVVIGHAHNDHTGGAEYLQRMYNPTILMGKLDWDTVMVRPTVRMRRGVDVLDGQKLTLGDTTITLFLLPGHTPGSLAGIIPVKYQGRTFNILNLTASRYSAYSSVAPFQRVFDEAKRAKVEAVVQVHPEIYMNRTAVHKALETYPPAGPHPLLMSPEKAARYMDVGLECGRARVAANKFALDNARTPEYYRTPAPAAPPAAAAPAAAPAGAGRGAGRGGQ